MINIKFVICLAGLFVSCSQKGIVLIESPDRAHSITVLTKDHIRYIMNGEHQSVPKSNYAKLDISQVSEIGDQLGICWDIDGFKWRLVNDQSVLIENNLDKTQFDLKEELEKTEIGAPTFKEYLYEGCVRVSIRENRLSPKGGAILTYR